MGIYNRFRKWRRARREPSLSSNDVAALKRGYGVFGWWPRRPGNFGDWLSCFIVKQMTGLHLIHSGGRPGQKPAASTLLAVGSVIRNAGEGNHIWGAGILSRDDRIEARAHYHAVRGPITYRAVRDAGVRCAEVFGDPALLLPQLYQPHIRKRYEIGVVPHYSDYSVAAKALGDREDVLLISPLSPDPLLVVNDILSCRRIVSSSLHGLIVAQSYGIPAAWAEFSDNLSGDRSKFFDYLLSTDQRSSGPINLRTCSRGVDFSSVEYLEETVFDRDGLMESFPMDLLPGRERQGRSLECNLGTI